MPAPATDAVPVSRRRGVGDSWLVLRRGVGIGVGRVRL